MTEEPGVYRIAKKDDPLLIDRFFLQHASPERVYDWLETHALEGRDALNADIDTSRGALELGLLGRNEPLIDLAVARFGVSTEAAAALFAKTGSAAVRKALFAGSAFGHEYVRQADWLPGAIQHSLKIDGADLVSVLIANPLVPPSLLEALLYRQAPFDDINDDDWHSLVSTLRFNPLIQSPAFVEDPDFRCAYGDEISGAILAIWGLFEQLEPNRRNAILLGALGAVTNLAWHPDKSFENLLARWSRPGEGDSAVLFHARSAIARLMVYRDGAAAYVDHPDPAVRASAYLALAEIDEQQLERFLSRDGVECVEALIRNPHQYETALRRERLRSLCWRMDKQNQGNTDLMRSFRRQHSAMAMREPTWFLDEEGVPAFADVRDPAERQRRQLDFIVRQLSVPVPEGLHDVASGSIRVTPAGFITEYVSGAVQALARVSHQDAVSRAKLLWVSLIMLGIGYGAGLLS